MSTLERKTQGTILRFHWWPSVTFAIWK